jgi:hypothetical protein
MKKTIFALLFASCALLSNSAYAQDKEVYLPKIYVDKEAIELCDDMICVRLGRDTYAVSHLSKDNNGYYVYTQDLRSSKSKADYVCSNCNRYFFSEGELAKHEKKCSKNR